MSHPDIRPYIWMLCGSFSFTLMGVLAHLLLHYDKACDWQTVALFRAGLVAVFGAIVARLTGAKLVFWPWRLWIRSVAGSCSMLCTFYAYDRLALADVFTLCNTFPLWVTVLSWPLYGQLPGPKMFLAILAGVLGVALVEQPNFATGNIDGVLSALAAAMFTAVAMLGLHSLRDIDPQAVVVHFSAVATVFCFSAVIFGHREHDLENLLDSRIMLDLLGMGVTALIGQLFLTLAFSTGAPAKVSVVGLTQIVFALVFSVWLFNHQLNAVALIGTALIIAPTAWLLTRSRPSATQETGDRGQETEKREFTEVSAASDS